MNRWNPASVPGKRTFTIPLARFTGSIPDSTAFRLYRPGVAFKCKERLHAPVPFRAGNAPCQGSLYVRRSALIG